MVTRGTRDVYIIGRGNRPEAYNLFFHRHQPLVSRRHDAARSTSGCSRSGEVHEPLKKASVAAACKALKAEGVEAVAVCFLHAYANPEHERIAGAMIRKAMPDVYLSLSHDILREYREFERMSTTVVNAYIGPKVGGYVKSLKSSLGGIGFKGDLSIMRSNGGVMTPEVATERPVAMMESGPVGGIIASAQVGLALGFPNVISFDMGGTTAKASLIREGEPTLAPGYYVGGYASGHPVMLPMIDVVEVGAGGGSIAWRDDIGALKVGPQSAGADPGPICYRGGGTEPTITDANVVLGRLDPDNFLGGTMKLDADGARRGIKEKIADPLKLDVIAAAQAIVDIAINKMSLAVREVSVAKGYDPRDFALVASGGAGPLHVCAIARELYIPTVIVPLFPSHFSALGMLLADERHDFTRTVYSDLASVDFGKLVTVHDEMVKEAKAQPAPRQERACTRSISTCATWARSSRCRCRSTLEQLKTRRPQGDPHRVRRALRASLRAPFAGRAGGDGQHPARRHRQAAEAQRSRALRRAAARAPSGERAGVFHLGQQAAHRQGLSPRGLGRRRARSPARR